MADETSLRKFLKNPRPYTSPPQPRAPCKVCILGNQYSGKTSVSNFLAKRYNATVIDVQKLVEPLVVKAREELKEKARRNAFESTIEKIKLKFREKIEQQKSK